MVGVSNPNRPRFQFSNPSAQRAEAELNLKEALALTERHAPSASPAARTPAGKAFRRVTDILAGKCDPEGTAHVRVAAIFNGTGGK